MAGNFSIVFAGGESHGAGTQENGAAGAFLAVSHPSPASGGGSPEGFSVHPDDMEKTDELETGAMVSVTGQTADTGDTTSIVETLSRAEENLSAVREDEQVAEAEGGINSIFQRTVRAMFLIIPLFVRHLNGIKQ